MKTLWRDPRFDLVIPAIALIISVAALYFSQVDADPTMLPISVIAFLTFCYLCRKAYLGYKFQSFVNRYLHTNNFLYKVDRYTPVVYDGKFTGIMISETYYPFHNISTQYHCYTTILGENLESINYEFNSPREWQSFIVIFNTKTLTVSAYT